MQRLAALNRFIDDLYNDQQVIADGVFPAELLERSVNFRPECRGVSPAFGVWANICGSDLVRDVDGRFYVLEDNLRVPSGVSYVLENRHISKRAFADLFERHSVEPVDAYTTELARMLRSIAPASHLDHPTVVVLTPGVYNSAYFEHSFLAQRMGVELVEGQDLFVEDEHVYMRTIGGPEPGRRDLSPHRRRVPRSGGLPPRLDARRAGPDAAPGAPATWRSPTRRARASPTTRSCTPGCPT